nr:hypothetical protein [Rhodococcus qingshengii]
MTDPDNSPARPPRPSPPRPAPERPDVSVRPLRPAASDETPKTVTLSTSAWIGSFVVLAGIAGVVVTSLDDVRSALEESTARDNPG